VTPETPAAPYALPDAFVQVGLSGGRTSAYMLHKLIEANGDAIRDTSRVQVVFSNTGREMPQTLDFVAELSRRWSVPITWVEYRPGENGQRFQVVRHNSAARDGEPFEALIRKKSYLPNPLARFCTSDLKVRPARDYLRSRGWDKWTSAIGLRADEAHRDNSTATARERWDRWCPMIAAGATKADVLAFWRSQPFDLALDPSGRTPLGNCDGCFLKSEATLAALARDYPERHAWWERMESEIGASFRPRYTRASLRDFVERQGDWLFSNEAQEVGALCQADGGECIE